MVTKSSGWYLNSLPLKFLFWPFKMLYTVFLIILVVFGVSLFTQTYFHQPSLLSQEIQQLGRLNQTVTPILDALPSIQDDNSDTPLNIRVTRQSYRLLSGLFFDITGINKALATTDTDSVGFRFQSYLKQHYAALKHFDQTLQVVSIRLGNISLFFHIIWVLIIVALTDGLVMRAIRQKNASRESAGIYHRAKYWRSGILWLSMVLYLSMPVVLNPYVLVLPISLITVMTFLQAMYLKKYL